ncbi:nuclease-related domain-containing protein [Nocardiopsis changdeensis]|uniref:NERD domain-containing protein n=1 Tax=Nocardiopsis changdeensis TaxID=2831969 RepID=A0A975QCB9_9ACTN|nr:MULTISPECIES: nuclease-related domain-containing protein [Nocardiopsis]QUX26468.1 NERD domain-containing protein [Nocardiopsis changdeensis]QYX40740.1 NERD domain-containing protein [Nocardiopsis sp. MT53]
MTDTGRSETSYRDASAGASARAMAREIARSERGPLLVKSGVAGLALGLAGGVALGWGVGLALGLVLALAVGLALRARGRASYWRRGALGERRTGRRLDRLRRRGCVVLHDLAVPGSRANIDHVVIGPFGVGVVDSKQRRGHVRFDGRGHLRIGNTGAPLLVKSVKWESGKVDSVLSVELGRRVPVLPVLAVHVSRSRFPQWREFECLGVPIMAANNTGRWLMSRQRALSASEVAVVADAVRARFTPHGQR